MSKENRANQKNLTNKEFHNCPLKNPTEEKVLMLKEVKKKYGTIDVKVVKTLQSIEMKTNEGKLLKDSIVPDLQRCIDIN